MVSLIAADVFSRQSSAPDQWRRTVSYPLHVSSYILHRRTLSGRSFLQYSLLLHHHNLKETLKESHPSRSSFLGRGLLESRNIVPTIEYVSYLF